MNRYLYVEARDTVDDTEPSLLSFDSVIVVAENEDEAYSVGYIAMREQQQREQSEGIEDHGHRGGNLVADYVAEIGAFAGMEGER